MSSGLHQSNRLVLLFHFFQEVKSYPENYATSVPRVFTFVICLSMLCRPLLSNSTQKIHRKLGPAVTDVVKLSLTRCERFRDGAFFVSCLSFRFFFCSAGNLYSLAHFGTPRGYTEKFKVPAKTKAVEPLAY